MRARVLVALAIPVGVAGVVVIVLLEGLPSPRAMARETRQRETFPPGG